VSREVWQVRRAAKARIRLKGEASMRRIAIAVWLFFTFASIAQAQIGTGTWVRRKSSPAIPPIAMLVEQAGAGLKITYKIFGPDGKPLDQVMTVVTALDGKEAPVMLNGKPSGETMATRKVDNYHTVTILKFDGKEFGTSKLEASPDGRTLKVENDITFAAFNQTVGKQIEYWDKQ
jgi:hypothetical protein